MINFNLSTLTLSITLNKNTLRNMYNFFERFAPLIITVFLITISVLSFVIYYRNGLGLAYNDARSHLDIGRRVVEGLKPGLAQLGSVWLPLPHALMIPTVWNDFFWHSGLSGALISMISFVGTGVIIYKFLEKLGVGLFGRLVGVLIFVFNLNILYLQSTAMTELLLIFTMTAGVYELVMWHKNDNLLHLVKAAFWIMLASLVRYDGWFLLLFAALLIALHSFRKWSYKVMEGKVILFLTLAAFGVLLWFLWNLLIFKDPLYFAFGPFSARAQQAQLEQAGVLATKGNLLLSLKVYFYALIYNSYAFTLFLGILGAAAFWLTKAVKPSVKIASIALLSSLFFNILALYLGHSVLFVQGISGNTWFNVRYGMMLLPAIAVFIGFLVDQLKPLRPVIAGLLAFVTFFAFASTDAVTIDDARVGSSQKNVTEVAGWLNQNAKNEGGFVLISVASHDAIIFSSGLPMKKFIHEGTGRYWESATIAPDRWARWIVMRTYDDNDLTYKFVKKSPGFEKFEKVESYPFADVYQLKAEYLSGLNPAALQFAGKPKLLCPTTSCE